jgi:Nif-specific regulatory protein
MEYTTRRKVGSGSFGAVYEVSDDRGSVFAAKVVEGDDPTARELLKNQFQFLSTLSHERIVRAIDLDMHAAGGPVMITEFVGGTDLKTFVEIRGRTHLLSIALKVLDALRHIHNLGRLHGDLKPDGILVSEAGREIEVKLVDAGFDFDKGTKLPSLAGTLPYLAPEIIRNLPADGRSDLYSLGAVLYEVLTGETPFGGSTPAEILRSHLEYVPPEPSKVRPDIDRSWDVFVARLLKKEPILRYRNATHAALELGRLFGMPAAFADNVVVPGTIPPLGLESAAKRIEDVLAGSRRDGTAKALMVCGARGCGVTRLLRLAETTAKVCGHRVTVALVKPGLPAFGQIVDSLRKFHSMGRTLPSPQEAESDPVGVLAEIFNALTASRSGAQLDVMIVDGCEAMEEAELKMLGRLVRRLTAGVALIVGYHTDVLKPSGDRSEDDFDIVPVDGLDFAALEGTLKQHLGVGTLPEGLARELFRATRGNRRFLEVMLRHLWGVGGLKYSAGEDGLELVWDRSGRIPDSATEIMQERLSRLPSTDLKILSLVCASGGRLAVNFVREFFSKDDWLSGIRELADEGFVHRMEGKAFLELTWEGLCDVAPGFVPSGWLKEASLELASIMEGRIGDRGELYGLGLLYLQAGQSEPAFRSLVAAGDHFAGFSAGDAVLAYGKALTCEVPEALRAEAREKMGDARLARGDLIGALADFEQASAQRPSSLRKVGWVHGLRGALDRSVTILAGCEKAAAGDLIERARVLSDLGYVYALQARREESSDALTQAGRFFEREKMPFEAGIALHRMGILEWRSGSVKNAAAYWENAGNWFERAPAKRHVGICLVALGLCHWKQMDFPRAVDHLERSLAIFKETKSLAEEARCRQNYGMVLADVGDLSRARSLAHEALELHVLLGQRSGIVSTRLLLAAIEIEAGNPGETIGIIDGLTADGYTLSTFEQSLAKRYLAGAAAMRGRRDALETIDESYSFACEAGDAEGQQQAMLEKSRMLVRFARPGEALDLASKAVTALSLSSLNLLATIAEGIEGEALCLTGETEAGLAKLLAAKAGMAAIPESVHMARVLRALAGAYCTTRDWSSFDTSAGLSADIARRREARYDYALALLLAGRASRSRGSFIRARRYLAEAGRILEDLGVDDLHRQAVAEMERIGPGETEITAVTSLGRISQTLNSSFDLTTVLNLAMDLAMEYLGAERGVLMLEDGTSGRPTTVIERKMDAESVEEVISISRSIVESVRHTREPVIASDATVDPRFMNSKSVRIHNVMSVMCVPLLRGDRLLGIIYLDNREVPSDFSRLERAFVEAFANQAALAIENARAVGKLYDDVADLRAVAGEKHSFANIIGPGKEMQQVFRQVEKAAKSPITVLLTGESGTGKELIAGLLHELSPRRAKPLVKVNCAAIHKDLLETELFGIEKHVATGVAPRSGFFERADGGTVLLDEIGDMPLMIQTKVLRALADKEFERVGGSKVLKVDVRVISATNQDLKDLIRKGLFRNDLYYRLNAMRIHIPPLRQRLGDLAVLVEHFTRKYAAENSKPPMRVSMEALEVLTRYAWPGNVRELEKCIEHAVVVADGTELGAQHFPREILESLALDAIEMKSAASATGPLPEVLRLTERDLIRKALRDSGGVKTLAAARLGIHESTLRKKMKSLSIQLDEE